MINQVNLFGRIKKVAVYTSNDNTKVLRFSLVVKGVTYYDQYSYIDVMVTGKYGETLADLLQDDDRVVVFGELQSAKVPNKYGNGYTYKVRVLVSQKNNGKVILMNEGNEQGE